MSQKFTILLLDLHTDKYVEGILHDRIDESFAIRADDSWKPYIASARAQVISNGHKFEEPEHAHWEWDKKVKATSSLLSYPTMGIECEGHVQGMMMLKTDGAFAKLPDQKGLPLVYVYFLATAPWNLPKIARMPRFKGVGTTFLRAAIETSIDLEFAGRISLHSLEQSETWYQKHNLIEIDGEQSEQGLKYFEMTAEQAAKFIGE